MSQPGSAGTGGAPRELLDWVRKYANVSPSSGVDELLAGVRRALDHTLAHPGRDREAAFSLLAADGLLTLAAERIAEDENPEARLREIIEALAESRGA